MTTDRKRLSGAAAVTAVAAALTYVVMLLLGPAYLMPGGMVAQLVHVDNLAMILTYFVVPLAGVVFWRRPWWGRWLCLGLLLCNLVMYGLLELESAQVQNLPAP